MKETSQKMARISLKFIEPNQFFFNIDADHKLSEKHDHITVNLLYCSLRAGSLNEEVSYARVKLSIHIFKAVHQEPPLHN